VDEDAEALKQVELIREIVVDDLAQADALVSSVWEFKDELGLSVLLAKIACLGGEVVVLLIQGGDLLLSVS
jgi:hypothetical protein